MRITQTRWLPGYFAFELLIQQVEYFGWAGCIICIQNKICGLVLGVPKGLSKPRSFADQPVSSVETPNVEPATCARELATKHASPEYPVRWALHRYTHAPHSGIPPNAPCTQSSPKVYFRRKISIFSRLEAGTSLVNVVSSSRSQSNNSSDFRKSKKPGLCVVTI